MANLSVRRGEPRHEAAAWDPFHMMEHHRAFDPMRLFREMMSGDPFAGLVAAGSAAFAPDVEIRETKDAYLVTADLPGVRADDLEVSVTGNRLTVSGKREEEQRREGDRFFAYERSYGAFSRSFAMPEGADLDQLKADLKEGVLTVTVPKHAEVQARRIPVGGTAPAPGKGEKGEKKAG
jgi:HSP20 family protein